MFRKKKEERERIEEVMNWLVCGSCEKDQVKGQEMKYKVCVDETKEVHGRNQKR